MALRVRKSKAGISKRAYFIGAEDWLNYLGGGVEGRNIGSVAHTASPNRRRPAVPLHSECFEKFP